MGVWLLRFVLFKFMFLNGVVKLQSKWYAKEE